MSVTTAPQTPPAASAAAPQPQYRVTSLRVLRSEWAKLWSLRSTWITLGVGLLFLVAFGIIGALRYKSGYASATPDPDFADSTVLDLSLFGTNFAQLAIGVLGVLVTAGEYATGMIRSTLAAVPKRLPVLWSKTAAFGVVAFAVTLPSVFVTFLVGSSILSGTPAALTLSNTGVVRSLVGAAVYLGLVGVMGAALGALLRSIAGGISVLVAALMLVPGLISLLPSAWQNNIEPYLPGTAGSSMFALQQAPHTLSPTNGFFVFAAWTALFLAAAAWRLKRTDV
jgi:ABC-2 type transport system permease protein